MENVTKRLTSAVLVAVLSFYMAFPVTGFRKPEQAYANPAVVVAPVAVFGTALAAYGIYCTATGSDGYEQAVSAMKSSFENASSYWSSSWSQYVQDQGSFDNALNSAVTADGTVSLQTFAEHGLFDSLQSYTAYCVDNGTMTTGTSSLHPELGCLCIGDCKFLYGTLSPSVSARLPSTDAINERTPIAFTVVTNTNGTGVTTTVLYSKRMPPAGFIDSGRLRTNSLTYAQVVESNDGSYYTNTSTAQFYIAQAGVNTGTSTTTQYWYVMEGIEFDVSGYDQYSGTYNDGTVATVEPGVYAGTAAAPTTTVNVFNPTAEQLASGWSSADVVDAINSGNAQTSADISGLSSLVSGISGVLNDIKTGVQGLETTIGTAVVGALGSVLSGIQTTVGTISTTLGDVWGGVQGWWTDWLAWVGATPLGQLIAQVIAAVNAGVISIADAIALVQSAVASAVMDLVGAIEAIQIPAFEFPEISLPTWFSPGTGTGLQGLDGTQHVSAIQAILRDKEPFCYLFAFSDGMQQVGERHSNKTFRIQQRFDILGQPLDIDINAEPYLLRDVGGTTIADLLRSSVTVTLCMGLLYGAYKTALAAVKS